MRRAAPIQKTFGFRSARQMLDKLQREVIRIESAQTIEDAADHCSNAAVTAWHLFEWTWALLKGERAQEKGWHKREDFETWLLSSGCPELQHCQILTTSFKHSSHEPKPGNPKFEAQPGPVPGQWTNIRGEIGTWVNSTGEPGYFVVGDESEWWIVEGEKKYLARHLFGKVAEFWRNFLDQHSIQ
jgi:hypothetical protein